jgi:plasmid segregation protein ParM
MSKVNRAIDLGYGLSKFVQSADQQGKPICRHFPSVAVASDTQTMRGLNVRRRDTIDDQVGNVQFEVGPDVLQAQTGNHVGREIGNNCCKSQNY